ncbi:MAG: holo-ACP synthase [Candidatus Tectimicrobiota bacterium]
MSGAVVGTGIDLVGIERFRRVLDRHGDRFLERVFTAREREECAGRADPARHLAVRFAVKEAVFKALGTGWGRGVRWRDVEVTADAYGRPVCTMRGAAQAHLEGLGGQAVLVSMAHEGDVAIAQAVAVG